MDLTIARTMVERQIIEVFVIKRLPMGTRKMVDYEKAKQLLKQYYPDYYELGIKVAADYVGV
jgi:hypothetical protein